MKNVNECFDSSCLHYKNHRGCELEGCYIVNEIGEAIKHIQKHLNEDEDYYMSWQANIALQFYDEYRRHDTILPHAKLHEIANNAAKNFLNLLLK